MNQTVRVLSTSFAALLFASLSQAAEPPTPEQEALMQRERDIAHAWLIHDAKTIAAYDADEFTFTDYDGSVYNKVDDLAGLATTHMTVFDADDMTARIYGDTGVVTGRVTQKGTYEGRDLGGAFRFTTNYVKRDGRWQCVASQMTRIEKP